MENIEEFESINIEDLLKKSVVNNELSLQPNDIIKRAQEIINLNNNEIDFIDAIVLLIEELELEESEFVKLMNVELKSLIAGCAVDSKRIKKNVAEQSM